MQENAENKTADICDRIRLAAAERGFTGMDLANKAGISYRLVYDINAGKANLRDKTIAKIAKALEVETQYLMVGTVKEPAGVYTIRQKKEPDRQSEEKTLPLHELIHQISLHIGTDEDEIMRIIFELMRKKTGGEKHE